MGRSTRNVFSAIGILAFLAAGVAASEHYAASRQRSAIELALRDSSARFGSLTVDPWRGHVSVANLIAVRGGTRISVGALDVAMPRFTGFAFSSPAFAAIGVVTAHDIRIESGGRVLTIPRLEARGMGLSTSDLARLFDPDSPRPLAQRLSKLSGSSIVAPEITMSVAATEPDEEDRSFALHGLALANMVAGKVGSFIIEGGHAVVGKKEGASKTLAVGRISASAIDLPLAATIAEGSRTEAGAPLRPLYEAFSIASIKFTRSEAEHFQIGAIQSTALSGRPLLVPFKRAMALLDKSGSDLSAEDKRQQTDILVDALKSFSLGRLEIRDIGYAKTGDDATEVALGRLLIDGLETFRSRSIAAEHFVLADKTVKVTFSRSALDGIDGSGLVDVVGSANGASDIAASPEQIRRLAPKLADASLLDFRVEAPAADLTGNANAGHATVFEMPVAEMRIGPFVGNLAATGSSHVQVIYDIASPAPGSGLEALAKAGFGRFDVTSDYAASWNETTHEYKLNQFSIAGKDLASLTAGGTMSNVLPDLMSPDKEVSARAAHQLEFRSLDLSLVDSGLAEKGLPLAAASMNLSIPDFKTAIKAQATDSINQILGPGPKAEQLAGAVSQFIDQPKRLDISVAAPGGLSVQTIMDASNPQDLLSKIEITAAANR